MSFQLSLSSPPLPPPRRVLQGPGAPRSQDPHGGLPPASKAPPRPCLRIEGIHGQAKKTSPRKPFRKASPGEQGRAQRGCRLHTQRAAWDAVSPPKRVFYPKPGRIPKRGGSGTRICHPAPPAGVPSTPPAPLGSALPHAAAQHRGSRVLGTGAQRPLLSPALQRARSTRGRQAVPDRLPKSSKNPPKRSPGTPHHGQGSGTGAARRDPRPPPARALPVRAAPNELKKSLEKPQSGIPKSCPTRRGARRGGTLPTAPSMAPHTTEAEL